MSTLKRAIRIKELFQLVDYLADHLGPNLEGCACDFSFTHSWLQERDLDLGCSMQIIVLLGGGCDCEIVYNFPETESEMAEILVKLFASVIRHFTNGEVIKAITTR